MLHSGNPQFQPCCFYNRGASLYQLCGIPSVVKFLQVVFIGSDGREYPFLVKPDDDLRKDSRMMETAGLLNRLFAKDPLSRRRNLYIRRYSI